MVTALLTRRAFAVAPRHFGARNIHIENTVETAREYIRLAFTAASAPHGSSLFADPLRNLNLDAHFTVPFKTGPKYKVPLAIGISSFLITGFSLPFVAAWFQIAKASS
ncbi:unnamed protein product [Tilletia controversa]|nr:unnamed protein product [Tilletia controversa]